MLLLERLKLFTWGGPNVSKSWNHCLPRLSLYCVFCSSKVCRQPNSLKHAAGDVWLITIWQRTWILLCDRMRTVFIFAWSRDWNTLLSLRTILSVFRFYLCHLVNQCVVRSTRHLVCGWKQNSKIRRLHWWESPRIPFLWSELVNTHKPIVLVYEKIAVNCMEEWMFALHGSPKHKSGSCKGKIFCQKKVSMQESEQVKVDDMEDFGYCCLNLQVFFDCTASD